MTRSIVAGMTDYSSQTLQEISNDLNEWSTYLSKNCDMLNNIVTELKESGFWEKAYPNFCNLILNCISIYERNNEEIDEIRSEINGQVQMHHVNRLNSIGMKADEINRELGLMWHREYPNNMKSYENLDFRKIETLYGKSRDTAANLLDLTNVAARLQNFVGKKSDTSSKSVDLNEVVELKPNFMGLGLNFNALIKRFIKKK